MQKTECSSAGKVMIRSACIACLGFVLSGIFLFIGAFLLHSNVLPENMSAPIAWGSVAFSVLCASFFAAGNDNRRMVGGLCTGAVYFLLSLLCGILLGGHLDYGKVAMMGSLVVADSVAGAILSGLIRG